MNIFRKYLLGDKSFYQELLVVGLPIVLQNLLTSSLNLIDTLMVGRLGEQAIASVGVSNKFYFVLNFVLTGVAAGCGIFISQYLGRKDKQGMRRSLGVSIVCSLSLGIFFMLLALLFPVQIIGLFQEDAGFIADTCAYFQIVCFSYPLSALTYAYASGLRNTGQSIYPMVSSAAGVFTNIFLNYVLIFGNFGAAAFGIRGAAIATLIARLVELLVILSLVYLRKTVFAVPVRELFSFSKAFFKELLRPISHTAGNELAWTLGTVAYTVAYGKLGIDALAISQIYSDLQGFFSIFFYGIASAAIVFVGREIGRGHRELAVFYGKRLTLLSAIAAVFVSSILFFCAPAFAGLFKLKPMLQTAAAMTIRTVALPFVCFAVNTVILTGVLRGGGDTKIPLLIEVFTMWCIGVPLAFIGAMFLKLPIYLVMPLVYGEEVLKTVIFSRRLLRGKWALDVIGE